MTIGKRLHDLRVGAGLLETALAEMGGVDHAKITQWEKGKGHPDANFLRLVSEKLDVLYIINGKTGSRTDAEHELLVNYRACSEEAAQSVSDLATKGKKEADDNAIDLNLL